MGLRSATEAKLRSTTGTLASPTMIGKAMRSVPGRALGRTMPGAIRHPATASMEDADDAELAKPIPGKSTGMRKPPVANEDEEMDDGMEEADVENSPLGSVLSGTAIGAAGGYAMNPTAAGALKGSTIGIGAGLAHGIATARKRKKKPQATTNSTQENTMKLKPEERAELVSNLTTNCECWKHEGSDEVLNAMPDAQLLGIYEQASTLEEMIPIINQIAQDFGVDPNHTTLADLPATLITNAVAAFDGSGDAGGGDTRANADEDDPEGNYISEEVEEEGEEGSEGNYAGDGQKKGIESATTNKREKPMTTNEWMKTAPPEIQVVVRNAMRIDAEEKETLIGEITANANNPYSEEQLASMSTEVLRPLAQLAKVPVVNRRPAPVANGHSPRKQVQNYYGKQGTVPVANRSSSDEDDDDNGMLVSPVINWQENLKELRGNKD